MPTYVCYAHRGQLTAERKADIAAGVAEIHSRFTGAPVWFTQCVFHELDTDDHFIGDQPAPSNGVWVYGHIRAERSPSARTHILLAIRDHLMRVLHIPDSVVWVYLNELSHTDMVEFGRVLPQPGDEQNWVDDLPAELRDHVAGLGNSRRA
jgi:phenylpyruvate tautomerase PptA (4-oxalocrotonate tautomerase family)